MISRIRFVLVIFCAIILCGFVLLENKQIQEFRSLNQAAVLPLISQDLIEKDIVSSELKKTDKYCNPEINANGIIAVYLDSKNNIRQTLYEKNADNQYPIASITKLMTAKVVLEEYSLNDRITISEEAASQEGNKNSKLKAGDEFVTEDLFYPMLIESNNGAARAFSEKIGNDLFVIKMNEWATKIGLESTTFFNSTGLDPNNQKEGTNISTARDIFLLTDNLLQKPIIWNILKTPRIKIYSSGNMFHNEVISTNEFLDKRSVLWSERIIGAKTGWTPLAKGCLVLVINAENGQGKIIAVILGSDNRFDEMEKLITWISNSYQ